MLTPIPERRAVAFGGKILSGIQAPFPALAGNEKPPFGGRVMVGFSCKHTSHFCVLFSKTLDEHWTAQPGAFTAAPYGDSLTAALELPRWAARSGVPDVLLPVVSSLALRDKSIFPRFLSCSQALPLAWRHDGCSQFSLRELLSERYKTLQNAMRKSAVFC